MDVKDRLVFPHQVKENNQTWENLNSPGLSDSVNLRDSLRSFFWDHNLISKMLLHPLGNYASAGGMAQTVNQAAIACALERLQDRTEPLSRDATRVDQELYAKYPPRRDRWRTLPLQDPGGRPLYPVFGRLERKR